MSKSKFRENRFIEDEQFNLSEFRSACRMGGFRSVILDGVWHGFLLRARSQQGGLVTLVTTRKRNGRLFRNATDALRMVHAMGAKQVEIALDAWKPEPAKQPMRRPDQAERLRKVHRAAKAQAEVEEQAQRARAEEERRAAAGMVLGFLKRGLEAGLFRDGGDAGKGEGSHAEVQATGLPAEGSQ